MTNLPDDDIYASIRDDDPSPPFPNVSTWRARAVWKGGHGMWKEATPSVIAMILSWHNVGVEILNRAT
jgi:hypothetical protein